MKEKLRDSNMEMLRIVSMLLVMIVHADFMVLKPPSSETLANAPIETFSRLFIGTLASVCVNVFIMISGWYGIKWSLKRLFKLLFQVLCISVLLFCFLTNEWSISACLHEFKTILLMEDYWFVKAYVILFLVAPALNAYADSATRQQFKTLLVSFFVIQTLFSYIGNSLWYSDGYSPLPFLTLYLLARYMRLYPNRFTKLGKGTDVAIYFAGSLTITCISMILLAYTDSGGRMFNYTSPLMIIISAYFFLFFTKVKSQSRGINWIAKSCVAAYLVHMNTHFFAIIFAPKILAWYNGMPGHVAIVYIAIFILSIFIASILLDNIIIHFANRLFK